MTSLALLTRVSSAKSDRFELDRTNATCSARKTHIESQALIRGDQIVFDVQAGRTDIIWSPLNAPKHYSVYGSSASVPPITVVSQTMATGSQKIAEHKANRADWYAPETRICCSAVCDRICKSVCAETRENHKLLGVNEPEKDRCRQSDHAAFGV